MAKLCTPKVRNEGSIPGQRAKIPHASRAKRTKAQNRSNFKNGPHKKKILKKENYTIMSHGCLERRTNTTAGKKRTNFRIYIFISSF